MRFKKPLIIAIIVVIVCAGIFLFSKGEKYRYVKRVTGFDISSCKILKSEDTHGGFLGDGEYILIADCGKEPHWPADLYGWKELPLPENIQLIMYGPEPDEYDYSLAGEAGIPYIENGYYYFENRHPNAEKEDSSEDLFDLFSFNFSLALYDADKDMLYYYDLDT